MNVRENEHTVKQYSGKHIHSVWHLWVNNSDRVQIWQRYRNGNKQTYDEWRIKKWTKTNEETSIHVCCPINSKGKTNKQLEQRSQRANTQFEKCSSLTSITFDTKYGRVLLTLIFSSFSLIFSLCAVNSCWILIISLFMICYNMR